MKQIKLTQGKVAMVDDEDFPELNKYKWHCTTNGYAGRRERVGSSGIHWKEMKGITMHRQIMVTPKGMHTDHRDGNPLNNQKSNLRICSCSDNLGNQKLRSDNTSGYKGVVFLKGKKDMRVWKAYITINQKRINLGHFDSASCAAMMYNRAAVQYFGQYAHLNKVTK